MGKNLLGKFQTMEFSSWKGLTRDNILKGWLGNVFRYNPNIASKIMVELASYKWGNSFESFINKYPVKEFVNDDEFFWNLIASARENYPLIEARDIAGNVISSGMAGAGTEPFYLVFYKDCFADGEFIVGNLNEEYQFRILGDGRMEGTNCVYKVELAGGNTDGVPADRLQAGELFSVEAAYAEAEMSRKMGDVRFATPVSMRNEFSHIRIQHKVPGNKINRYIGVGLPMIIGGKKTTSNYWMHYVDYAVERQFSEYKNNAYAYGRSNRNPNGEYTNIGKSGGILRTGDGLYAQMEAGNVRYYNNFSLKLIEDMIDNIVYGKQDFDSRKVVIKTGEKGAKLFSKAVTDIASGWSIAFGQSNGFNPIQKTTSELHSNAYKAGFQFTEFVYANNIHVIIEVDHQLDDPVRNKIKHPLGGPASSYIFRIMDIGDSEQPNIFRCTVKDENEYRGYQWGPFRDPFTGRTGNMNASFDEDAAVIHKYATLGVCVLDATRTATLKPSILAA